MTVSKETRITVVIVAGVVILGIAGLSVLSGAELNLVELTKVLGAGVSGAVAGYVARRGS